MSIKFDSISFTNPNPAASSSSMALSHVSPPSLGFQSFVTHRMLRSRPIPAFSRPLSFNRRHRYLHNRSLLLFAASHEEPKGSDIDLGKENEDLKAGVKESQEEWQETLSSFKEQALKMQSLSKEAYGQYSKKAFVVLKETSEKLKIQAEKTRQDLSVIAKEVAEESKEYLTTAAENSPEPVKDIVETFATSSDELTDVSKVRDFYVGIPYGALLSVGGFLSFMLTGSIPAIRFGIILGGTLLALGISSLRSWKKGEPSPLYVKGQAAIAAILFLRELRLLSMRPFIANFITTLVSGGVVAFYFYRIVRDKEQSGSSTGEVEPET